MDMRRHKKCDKTTCLQYLTATTSTITCLIIVITFMYTLFHWSYIRTLVADMRLLVNNVNTLIPKIENSVDNIKELCSLDAISDRLEELNKQLFLNLSYTTNALLTKRLDNLRGNI